MKFRHHHLFDYFLIYCFFHIQLQIVQCYTRRENVFQNLSCDFNTKTLCSWKSKASCDQNTTCSFNPWVFKEIKGSDDLAIFASNDNFKFSTRTKFTFSKLLSPFLSIDSDVCLLFRYFNNAKFGKLSVFIKSQRSSIRKKIFDSKSSKNKWLPVILQIDKGVDHQIQIAAKRRIKDTTGVISIDNLGFRLNCTTLRRTRQASDSAIDEPNESFEEENFEDETVALDLPKEIIEEPIENIMDETSVLVELASQSETFEESTDQKGFDQMNGKNIDSTEIVVEIADSGGIQLSDTSILVDTGLEPEQTSPVEFLVDTTLFDESDEESRMPIETTTKITRNEEEVEEINSTDGVGLDEIAETLATDTIDAVVFNETYVIIENKQVNRSHVLNAQIETKAKSKAGTSIKPAELDSLFEGSNLIVIYIITGSLALAFFLFLLVFTCHKYRNHARRRRLSEFEDVVKITEKEGTTLTRIQKISFNSRFNMCNKSGGQNKKERSTEKSMPKKNKFFTQWKLLNSKDNTHL